MDLALPPMPFSAVCVPVPDSMSLQIPEEMRNAGIGSPINIIELPTGVVQVIVTWKGVEPLSVLHYTGSNSNYESITTIPASSTVGDRSTGVLTFASDKRHGVRITNRNGTNWNADTLSKGYVAGVQVMPMGTAADITGGGSLLRVDNSVGTRVFLGDMVLYGDTGVRDLRNTLPEGCTAASFQLSRVGDVVFITIVDLVMPTSGTAILNTTYNNELPTGFRPWPRHRLQATGADYINIDTAGGLAIYGATGQVSATIAYRVNRLWPDSLPGRAQ